MFDGGVLLAFSLTLLAGLATVLGAGAVLTRRTFDERHLAPALGLSAGVMLWVSFLELMPTAAEQIGREYDERAASAIAVAAFFGGVAIIMVIDRLVPETANPHELRSGDPAEVLRMRLMRTGVLTAGAIAIHNVPEGFATFVTALEDPQLGVAIAIAIAIHNVPEGISVAVPVRYATGSRTTAFTYALIAGLAEPFGALVGYLLFAPLITPTFLGVLLAGVAGIMVFISLDELLPAARRYDEHHRAVYGLVGGMAIMAVSLLALA